MAAARPGGDRPDAHRLRRGGPAYRYDADRGARRGTTDAGGWIQDLAEAPVLNRVALLPTPFKMPGVFVDTDSVRVYDTGSFALVGRYSLRSDLVAYADGGQPVVLGRYIFTTPTMDSIYVVAIVDGTHNDSVLVTITP